MAIRKFGAPAMSHVRHITAEDAEPTMDAELQKNEEEDDNETSKEDQKDDFTDHK